MEKVVENIPASLHGELSKKLMNIILEAKDKNAIPVEVAKNIIYLWRQDQLASQTGITVLLDAATTANAEATVSCLEELGLQEVAVQITNE